MSQAQLAVAVAEVERLERLESKWRKDTARAERKYAEVSEIANRHRAEVERLRAALLGLQSRLDALRAATEHRVRPGQIGWEPLDAEGELRAWIAAVDAALGEGDNYAGPLAGARRALEGGE